MAWTIEDTDSSPPPLSRKASCNDPHCVCQSLWKNLWVSVPSFSLLLLPYTHTHTHYNLEFRCHFCLPWFLTHHPNKPPTPFTAIVQYGFSQLVDMAPVYCHVSIRPLEHKPSTSPRLVWTYILSPLNSGRQETWSQASLPRSVNPQNGGYLGTSNADNSSRAQAIVCLPLFSVRNQLRLMTGWAETSRPINYTPCSAKKGPPSPQTVNQLCLVQANDISRWLGSNCGIVS